MQKLKFIIFSLVVLSGLVFLFSPGVAPDNFQFQEILNLVSQNDVVIIFNSGGWGNTPLEKAEDFAPIVEGIQQTLNDWGYNSVVIPFVRTKDNLSGKITGAKDFFNSFEFCSEVLAQKVEFLAEEFPDKKIIMAGLSAGGAFVDKTYEKISEEVKGSVYTIVVGAPFWVKPIESENMLSLENNGKDSLVKGDVKTLILTLLKTPFRWILAKINGQNLTFSQAFRVPGHNYDWSSPEVGPQIVTFLKERFKN